LLREGREGAAWWGICRQGRGPLTINGVKAAVLAAVKEYWN
jgi:hypothetical protein